jgi:predicted dehydrogenase
MKRLGIIGAENSHAAAIAKELNVEQAFPAWRVTHLWGETDEFAQKTAAAGRIPTIVKQPGDMLGQVDAVMVDHRDGGLHLAAATPFVEAGVRVFVDKPISTSLDEARRFLDLRRRQGVAVTTMSSVPHQAGIAAVREGLQACGDLRGVHVCGPGDPDSQWGGVFFYGIHQADLLVELLGTGAATVWAQRHGKAMLATVALPGDVVATIAMPGGVKDFSLSAVGAAGGYRQTLVNDAQPYRATAAKFLRMFETGAEPFDDRRMLAPIALLHALRQSLASGRPEPVPPAA